MENPYVVDGFLASCYDKNQSEGWKFAQDYGITVSNIEKFSEVSGVICALIASLIPDDDKSELELYGIQKQKN